MAHAHPAPGIKTVAVDVRHDLYALLEGEAERVDVDVAQYLRDAALTRAIAGSMLGTETRFELLARAVREVLAAEAFDEPSRAAELVLAAMARLAAAERLEESQTLRAESMQVIRKAKDLADRFDGLAGSHNGGTPHPG